ncbi:MAG: hypothetical protein ACTTJW_08435 [Sphaerochaeta sp.]
MRKNPAKVFILCVLSISLLSSCVVTEKLTLGEELSGKSHADIFVDDFFVGVVEDLSNWDSRGSEDPILEVAVKDVKAKLESSDTASSVNFREAGHNTYVGDFAFSDFEKLIADISGRQTEQRIVKVTERDNKTRIDISINMDNYEQLTHIIPFLADPNFEVYGPLYNNSLTKEEYLEMVSFILGEQCPESITNSSIKLQFVTSKAIINHNGKLRNPKTVEFSFPLIDFLLLHNSIDFYFEY